LRKKLARSVAALADQAPTSSQEYVENAPDSKTSYATAFFDSIADSVEKDRQ
jgi:hypothetical protein